MRNIRTFASVVLAFIAALFIAFAFCISVTRGCIMTGLVAILYLFGLFIVKTTKWEEEQIDDSEVDYDWSGKDEVTEETEDE